MQDVITCASRVLCCASVFMPSNGKTLEKAQGDVGQGYNKELPSHPFGATRVDRLQYMGQIFGY